MRISDVYISRFLSFDEFVWRGLDPQINLLVGPNGVGKTNLMHAVRAVFDGVSHNRYASASEWAQLAHSNSEDLSIEIGLDIELTEPAEQRMLAAFFAAAFCQDEHIRNDLRQTSQGNLDRDSYVHFSQMVQRQFTNSSLSWLYKGRLVVRWDGSQWLSWYANYITNKPWFYLGLNTGYGSSIIRGTDVENPNGVPSIFTAWKRQLPDEEQNQLISSLVQFGPDTAFPMPDPSHLPAYAPKSGVQVIVNPPSWGTSPTHQNLSTTAGITFQSGQSLEIRQIFQLLLERSFVFTNNVRQLPKYRFSQQELDKADIELHDGQQLASFLFQLMTGTVREKERYAEVQDLFYSTTRRKFDLSKRRQRSNSTGAGADRETIHLDIEILEPWGHIPLAYSGAGISEALFLSTLMTGGKGQIVLLDEPASSLHPTLQSSLLNKIENHQGAQFIISTHSAHFVPVDGLDKVSRFTLLAGTTSRSAMDLSQFDEQLVMQMRHELRASTDARELLFHRAVILVEGETEQYALPVWFSKLGYSLSENDIGIYSVGSDQNFAPLVAFLSQMAIPWVIVCDGKVIADPQPPAVNIGVQLTRTHLSQISDLGTLNFLQRRQVVSQWGVFTTASNPGDEIEQLQVFQKHHAEAVRKAGRSKARRGYYIAEKYDCPEEIAHLRGQIWEYLQKKGAVNSVNL